MLGSRFSRLVHASLAGGSLLLVGCVDRAYDFGDSGSFDPDPDDPDPNDPDPNDPDPDPDTQPPPPPPPPDVPGPPQLVDAQFLDNMTLALTFTEAMAPPTTVDPAQFRLSAAFAPQGEYYYTYGTFYQDPAVWNGEGYDCDEYCYEDCYQDQCYERCWEYCYTPGGPPVRVVGLRPLDDRPEVLLLSLDNGISGGVCHQLEGFPDQWISDLFVHYTAQGAAPLTDTVGEPLAPIAEHWALQPGLQYTYVDGFFAYMQPMLPIPCPF